MINECKVEDKIQDAIFNCKQKQYDICHYVNKILPRRTRGARIYLSQCCNSESL